MDFFLIQNDRYRRLSEGLGFSRLWAGLGGMDKNNGGEKKKHHLNNVDSIGHDSSLLQRVKSQLGASPESIATEITCNTGCRGGKDNFFSVGGMGFWGWEVFMVYRGKRI